MILQTFKQFNFKAFAAAVLVLNIFVVCICTAFICPAYAAKNQPVTIAAIVNDDVISDFDLNRRIDFVMKTSSVPNTAENRKMLKKQLLDTMIDELLKRQEAKKYNISNTPDELEEAVITVEAQNGLPAGGLRKKLKDENISSDLLYSQIDTDLLWIKTVRASLSDKTNITEKEAREKYNAYVAEASKLRYLLAEIVLPFTSPQEEEKAYNDAMQILNELKNGAPFNVLAEKYSGSKTAKQGGDLGWVTENELPSELHLPLSSLEIGQVSIPLKIGNAFNIVLLREKQGKDNNAKLALAKVTVPVAYKKKKPDFLKSLKNEAKTCPSFVKWGKNVYSAGSGFLNEAPLSDFPDNIQKVLKKLPPKTISAAVKNDGNEMFFMICNEPVADIMSFEEVRHKLENEELNSLANRRLRELKGMAIIEIRE